MARQWGSGDFIRMRTCLAAIDFSAISPKVIECAAQLATATAARLEILHVIELPPLREPGSSFIVHSAMMDPLELKSIEGRLEQIAEPLRKKGLSVETMVTVGVPSDEILKEATSQDAAMLILGSHGHGALLQLFAGSVVTAVLRQAEIPVTVVPIHGN